MAKNGLEALSPFPFWRDLTEYSFFFFRRDLVAAISIALMALPQSMAYAFLAGLPTSAGIFAAIFGTIFTASFGASRALVSGPTNTVAILIQSGTSEILETYYPTLTGTERDLFALQVVLQITIMIGIFQIVGGVLRAGRITQFASRSVVVGYITVVALAIALSQIYPFLGIKAESGYHPLVGKGWFLLGHLKLLHIPTALIALGSLFLLIWLTKMFRRLPSAVIVFVIAGIVVAVLGLSPETTLGISEVKAGEKIAKVTLLQDVGPVKIGVPKIGFPIFNLRLLVNIVPLAFAITLLTALEATSIGRNYHKATDPPYSSNQEVFGLGVSNFFSSFLGAMPSSGSFSRSTLNVAMGGKTRFSAIFSGIFLLIIVVLFGFLVAKIPLAALAALMLYTAFMMVNFKDLALCMKATRVDAVVVVFTFLSGLMFNLDVALYVGVVLSVILYLRQAAVPLLVEYSFNNIGKLRLIEVEDERLDPRICIVQPEGELFFGAAETLQMKLRELAEDEMLVVVIFQLLNTRHVDASICLALRQLHKYIKTQNKILLVSGVNQDVWDVMRSSGLLHAMGEERFFKANDQLPSEPTRNAYTLAKTLISQDRT